jgi:D-amino-acid dehydrogenase
MGTARGSAVGQPDVLIVGGGALGLCCAYYARERGLNVCVVEQGELGRGASWGNAGLLPVSATVPLAGSGVIRKSLGLLLERDGAFRIQPRASPSLARWLLEFRRQCTSARAAEVNSLLVPMMRQSVGLLEGLLAREGINCEFSRTGTLTVCAREAELAELAKTDALLSAAGVECRRIGQAEALEIEPTLRSTILGGTHYPEDAHLDPGRLVAGIAERLRAPGAEIRTGISVERLVVERGRVVGAETSAGVLRANVIVVAAGIRSPSLVRPLGIELLIEPAKGYHLEFADLPRPRLPLRLFGAKTIVTPLNRAVRMTSKLELTPRAGISRRRILKGIPKLVSEYLDIPEAAPLSGSWFGFRPMTPDGLPYIGRADGIDNLVLATGHGQLGVALAPVTGLLVAEILSGEASSLPLEAFSVANRYSN